LHLNHLNLSVIIIQLNQFIFKLLAYPLPCGNAGIVSGTRPTAKMNPSIHKDNIPINMLERFNQEMLPA
jgi:hypothetical protein